MDLAELSAKATIAAALITAHAVEIPAVPKTPWVRPIRPQFASECSPTTCTKPSRPRSNLESAARSLGPPRDIALDFRLMADQEQRARLRNGVKVWNQWRTESIAPIDLTDADLADADLSSANLTDA